MRSVVVLFFCLTSLLVAQYRPANERVPPFPREFRAAWIACVYNIDWPSKPGLPAATQKAELVRMLDKAAALKLNAVIFQVRPNADAVYASAIEPWSGWISGTMGKSPGYDPLTFCIQQAHARGIEVHAWFNPFRALPNKTMAASSSHVSRKHSSWVLTYRNYKWINPANQKAKYHSLNVMLDVVKRYDIDGLHIDDYFYPYPEVNADGSQKKRFPDGLSDAQRRAHIDGFVQTMYTSVKKIKPHVRVGISPFGIWKPGVPAGIEATINPYEHLAADSRKWLKNGWCDYMSPQLYWRIKPQKQSFSALLTWWRQQGTRPVWPGIATARIDSKDDPGRPASEIYNQVSLSRSIGRNWVGHVHWSMKTLMQNKGGISTSLTRGHYASPALVPPMPWLSNTAPATPPASAKSNGTLTTVRWNPVANAAKYAIQARYGKHWYAMYSGAENRTTVTLKGNPDAIAVTCVDRFGTTSAPSILAK